jgi:hypothetical protein
MFYDTNYSFREMMVIWLVVMGLWGLSLVLALKLARIDLTALQKVVVIQAAGLTALFPAVGPFLAPIVAIYLIYRMADAELFIVVVAVVITRFIAAVVAIIAERGLVRLGLL